jgi:RHS repeat-associated protein
LGRFLQADPASIADDLNLYAYVGNNLVNYAGPPGEFVVNIGMGRPTLE